MHTCSNLVTQPSQFLCSLMKLDEVCHLLAACLLRACRMSSHWLLCVRGIGCTCLPRVFRVSSACLPRFCQASSFSGDAVAFQQLSSLPHAAVISPAVIPAQACATASRWAATCPPRHPKQPHQSRLSKKHPHGLCIFNIILEEIADVIHRSVPCYRCY